MSDRSTRASDGDRERFAAVLREACAEGRLTVEEFRERLDTAYAARTLGELSDLTADLPEIDPYQLPVPARPAPPPARRPRRPLVPAAWASWASVSLVCVAIWLITALVDGQVGYFWPIWVAGPWGAVLLAEQLFRGR